MKKPIIGLVLTGFLGISLIGTSLGLYYHWFDKSKTIVTSVNSYTFKDLINNHELHGKRFQRNNGKIQEFLVIKNASCITKNSVILICNENSYVVNDDLWQSTNGFTVKDN